jgi:hypothetical protein
MQAQAVLARRRARGAAESLGDRGRRVMDLLPVELLPARRGAVVEADVAAGAAAASQRNPPAVALRTQATKIYMFTLFLLSGYLDVCCAPCRFPATSTFASQGSRGA